MSGEALRAAVEWLVRSLAEGTDEEGVASHLAPRVRRQGDMVLALSRSPRFAAFREHRPVIERIEMSGQWTAIAQVSAGSQRWELEVDLQPDPPYLIRHFSPRPVASDAVGWDDVAGRLRAADRPATSMLPAPVVSAVHDRLVNEVNERRIPGLAVGIAVDGHVVHRECLGLADLSERSAPVTVQSVFQFGSITKVITALGVLALEANQTLDLDTPIDSYLPVPALLPASGSARLPTVRDVMLHRAGLPRDVPEIRRALQRGTPLADAVIAIQLTTDVGSRPEYSNLGYSLLAAVIERTAGEPLAQFLADHVLSPLGMGSASLPAPGVAGPVDVTGYRMVAGTLAPAPPHVSPPGSGGATGTLSDALTLAIALGARHDDLVRRGGEITGSSPTPGARFCPGYAIAVLTNKTPPDSFGPLNADLAALI